MDAALSLCGSRHHHPARATVITDARHDPTETTTLRVRMRGEADKRWQLFGRTMRSALIEHDLLGLRGIGKLPFGDKAQGLGAWLDSELNQKVYAEGLWLNSYVRKAAVTAQQQVDQRAPGGKVDPTRVAAMEGLARTELQGIVGHAKTEIIRVATHSMLAGVTPTNLADGLKFVINAMRNRTAAMCERIIAKTHATATLSAYRDAGVEQVGIIPERVRHTTHGLVSDTEGDLPSIHLPIPTLIKRARQFWRERFKRYMARYGARRAMTKLTAGLEKEETRLAQAEAKWAGKLHERGEVYIARRQAEGEALRARQQLFREELKQAFQALTQKSAAKALETRRPGPGARARREETPSPSTISRIEAAQKRLQTALGGDLVDVITAGDEFVCQECEDISDDGPYTLDEAENLVPVHPYCRCSFVPAGKYKKDAAFDAKVSKASVHYRAATTVQRCGNCVMFVAPDACTYVEGDIDTLDVCDAWEAPAKDFNPYHDPKTGQFSSGMQEATPARFVEARDVSARPQFLSAHPAEELADHTLLLNEDGTVGISVDPHGDIQNVFNNGGPKGGAAKAMVAAIAQGGRTLDCYDGFLPKYYHQFGFEEDQRMKFNPEFAPPAWDYEKHDNPDIVFMSWRGYVDGGAQGALERASTPGDKPIPTKAQTYGNDWDAAKAASRKAAVGGRARDHRLDDRSRGSPVDRARDQFGFRPSSGHRRAVDADWDESKHPRGEHGRFAPAPGDEVMSQEERDRYHDLEERYDRLSPDEKKEYEDLSGKFDKWWTQQLEENTRQEKERQETAYRDRIKADAEAVAKKLDFDPKNIVYTDETHEFILNGQHLVAGGHVERGGEQVFIHMNDLRASDPKGIQGMVAHEIEHAKFNNFINAYVADRDAMLKDPGPKPDPEGRYYWQKRGGSDAVMKPDGSLRAPYDEKYPAYSRYNEVVEQSHLKLTQGDGVTNYSIENWKAFNTGQGRDWTGAVHETLAEMAMLKYTTGKLPEAKDYYGFRSLDWRMKNPMTFGFVKPENPLDIPPITKAQREAGRIAWHNLYRAVDKAWKERRK